MTSRMRTATATALVPVWQGKAQAGTPGGFEDDPNILYIEPLACDPTGKNTIAFEICGNSMTGDNLFEGDIALVWKCPFAQVGTVVAALTPDGEVIKRLFPSPDGQVWLYSSNRRFPPKPYAANEVTVIGIVKEIIRANKQRPYQPKFNFMPQIKVI